MGSGKTTFIKSIGHVLGVKDGMSSPTFSIVNEYETSIGEKLYHFDFYRLKNELEAYDIGTEEYFDSGKYCFVEWPDKVITNQSPALNNADVKKIVTSKHYFYHRRYFRGFGALPRLLYVSIAERLHSRPV
jgi:tRNA threonylcarbamoyl adenosine modification protein YjeE